MEMTLYRNFDHTGRRALFSFVKGWCSDVGGLFQLVLFGYVLEVYSG